MRARPFQPGDFIDAAGTLAGELSPEARAAIAAAWPADGPHPAVVAHLLAVMLADVRAEVSSGFIRAAQQGQRLPPKAPPNPLGLAAELARSTPPTANSAPKAD